MRKVKEMLFLFPLLLSFAFAEIDPILDKVEQCWPNQRFGFVTYTFGRTFSDENYYDLLTLFGNNPPRLIGVRNR